MSKRALLSLLLLCAVLKAGAQEFVNLTASEVRIDSVLPLYYHNIPLGANYADSIYSVSIDYPEFIDMSEADIRRYEAISDGAPLPALPEVHQYIGVSRRQGTLCVSFIPLVFREGKYQKLVSFRLSLSAETKAAARANTQKSSPYASHSVLASGRWAKIMSCSRYGYLYSRAAVVKNAVHC